MQMKAVLPNGTHVTASRCQNQDIFFALRGGGGASLGVVTETTASVFPEVPLQVSDLDIMTPSLAQYTDDQISMKMAVIAFAAPLSSKEVTSLLVNNGLKWAQDGWGAYVGSLGESTTFVLGVNPKLSLEQAKQSFKPLTDFAGPRNNGSLPFGVDVSTVENYWEFVQNPATQMISGLIDGISVAQASRLVPRQNFENECKREELVDVLMDIPYGLNMVGPIGYEVPKSDRPGGPGEASVTPAWVSTSFLFPSIQLLTH